MVLQVPLGKGIICYDGRKNFVEHPTAAIYWNNLGLAWREKGQYDIAIAYYEKALVELRKFGLDHYVVITEKELGGRAPEEERAKIKTDRAPQPLSPALSENFLSRHREPR